MARRRRKKSRARGTIQLAVVFTLLVGINVYAFFFSDWNLSKVKEQAAATAAEQAVGGEAAPAASADAPTERTVEGVVEAGDSLGTILVREGIGPVESDELIRALSPVMSFAKELRAGQPWVLRFDDQERLSGFELRVSPVALYVVERSPEGRLVGRKATAGRAETRVVQVAGTIRSSLYEAVVGAGEDPQLVAAVGDLFAYDVNFYIDPREGDSFKVIVEKIFLGDEFHRYGRILAAEYAGKETGTLRAFHWQDGYFDAEGQNTAKSMLKTPLKFTRISSDFSARRMHPVLHRDKAHLGIDYAAPSGTPVWASAAGKVSWVGAKGGAGNCVIVDHGGGLQTVYMHLSRFAKGLAMGQKVRQKQIIGYVGQTGLATGPHLHFGLKRGGEYVDPDRYEVSRQAAVPDQRRAAFRAAIAQWRAALDAMSSSERDGR